MALSGNTQRQDSPVLKEPTVLQANSQPKPQDAADHMPPEWGRSLCSRVETRQGSMAAGTLARYAGGQQCGKALHGQEHWCTPP